MHFMERIRPQLVHKKFGTYILYRPKYNDSTKELEIT